MEKLIKTIFYFRWYASSTLTVRWIGNCIYSESGRGVPTMLSKLFKMELNFHWILLSLHKEIIEHSYSLCGFQGKELLEARVESDGSQ